MRKIIFLSLAFLVAIALLLLLSSRPVKVAFSLLGFDRPKEYLILLQNNMELRATGGFLGSYARIKVDRANIFLEKIEDIYTPDGQLDGHVDPPWPIQAAFGQGWFKLRDSNWDPDFPVSAKTIDWFFEHGKEPRSDGLVAVNLTLLEDFLRLTGSILVLDEPEKITYDNFYKKTQAAVENGFFPGSVQKRNFLGKLGKAVFENIKSLSLTQKLKLPGILWRLLKQRQILVFSHDSMVQSWLEQQDFAGGLVDLRGLKRDYLSIFESNLGANKANCCIKREVKLGTSVKNDLTIHELKIYYENTNPATLKQPPQSWGGAYVNFLRIGIPLQAEIISIKVGETVLPVPSQNGGNESVTDLMKTASDSELLKFITGDDSAHLKVDVDQRKEKGIQFIGFFVLVDALNSKDVTFTYSLPTESISKGSIIIQKQSGLREGN